MRRDVTASAVLVALRRAALLAGATAAVVAGGVPTAASAQPARWTSVVVTGVDADGAAAAVRAAGGRVVADLPVVRGVAAQLPAGTALGPQWVVAPARELHLAEATTGGTGAPSTVRATLGLPATGDEGRGVTVAVVDTGVADVPDLAGRIAGRVDLTGTGAAPRRWAGRVPDRGALRRRRGYLVRARPDLAGRRQAGPGGPRCLGGEPALAG